MNHPFNQYRKNRQEGTEKLLETDDLLTKRFMGLDKLAYKEGALSAKTKELLGLTASMVLRCNDCIDYHLEAAIEAGNNKAEIDEAIGISMLVGGSIVIPHARHAAKSLEFLFSEADEASSSVD